MIHRKTIFVGWGLDPRVSFKVIIPRATILLLLFLASVSLSQTVLVEAEGFADTGGWMVDQQYIDQMGSPVLLAHGMGVPVVDASTIVEFPKTGKYRVWVRTRNWVAPWTNHYAPGKFQLQIEGQNLSTTFGVENAEWHWQNGGAVVIKKLKTTIQLHDLTGFDGRCDAVLFSADPGFRPPEETKELLDFKRLMLNLRNKPKFAGRLDLVVVGGGVAGTCAAISAARLGLQVALVQNRPVLGGNNSSEVRVHLNGKINLPPYPALGNVVRELDSGHRGNAQPASHYNDAKKLMVAEGEKNLQLFLQMHAYKVQMKGERITAVIARHIRTNQDYRFEGNWFADCTGDGNLGYLAGADFRMGRESKAETGESLAPEKADKMTMGTSVQWYAEAVDQPAPFPECPWAIQFKEDTCFYLKHGDWNWETGLNRDQIKEFEFIRDHGLRAVYGNWAYLKNHSKRKAEFANLKLSWVAYIGGKRESRRLLGDVILQEQDIVGRKEFPDAMVTTTWSIDLHYPHPKNTENFPGEEFRSIAKFNKIDPYPIPYRCLYSRNVPNLFMAGRDISVTHVALGTVRVMRTCGMMGEVVGMAASLCKKHDAEPRDVYHNYLDELKELATKGIGKFPRKQVSKDPPAWLKKAGDNLARLAKVTVSSCLDAAKYPPVHINDGKIDMRNNGLRWVSDRSGKPQWVEFRWDQPQTISAARIVTGYFQPGYPAPGDMIHDFRFEYYFNDQWKGIQGAIICGNQLCDWCGRIPKVTTDRLRINITASSGNTARIWEVELYDPASDD